MVKAGLIGVMGTWPENNIKKKKKERHLGRGNSLSRLGSEDVPADLGK